MARPVALFITCLTDQFYPNVGIAVTKVLEHFGCKVSFPDAQTCCGQPFFNNGFQDDTQQLAKRFVEVFEPFDHIVTPSGSCCAMVREYYPTLLGDDPAWSAGMRRVVSRTFEFVEFLTNVLHVNLSEFKLDPPTRLTYHYTCHLRGLGMTDQAVKLMQQIGGVEYRALEQSDQCCGFGGTFAVKYPQISGTMAADKVSAIVKTGAEVAICNDVGCTMNLSGMCHRRGAPVRFRHIAELIADAIGADASGW